MIISVRDYDAIVMGASAGGLAALTTILETLPMEYTLPILLVQHRAKDSGELFEEVLQRKCRLHIQQADEKVKVKAGSVFVAPPDYHVLVEMDHTLSLSLEPPINFSRPSIDVLFESAALAYGSKLIGIILTGSNNDGAAGISRIQSMGGLTIAQDPNEAQFSYMTQAAINTHHVDCVWSLSTIVEFLCGHIKIEIS